MLKPYTRPNLAISDLLNPADERDNMEANLSETVHDERDLRFTLSRQKKYDGIVEKGGVRPVPRSEGPEDANFVGNRFVLTIKEAGTKDAIYKARWIMQGHHDKFRHSISNNSPMLMRMMLRATLSISATFFDCVIWTRGVEQAYMQSEPLRRDVFTEPPPEAKLSEDKVLKIELTHYGLVESSSCFVDTYYPVFTKLLDMKCSAFDPCLLYRLVNSKLSGITGLASDDSINTGDEDYQKAEERAMKKFLTRKNDNSSIRFLGVVIERKDLSIEMDQDVHIRRLRILGGKKIDHDAFRTVRGQLLLIAQSSRPDIAYDVAQLCQVPYKQTKAKNVKLLNEVVTHLKETADLKLKYPKLDNATLRLYIFVDSGYNTNVDHSSQLGVAIFLAGATNACHFIHWRSSKCPRITRSMLASETYAFSQGYDNGISLRMLLKSMNCDVPLYVFTDAKSIFDTVTKSKRLREIRLMNEIADIRRAYRADEITNIAWIRSGENIADNFTCHIGNDILSKTMGSGRLRFAIEQWVYKKDDMRPSSV